MTILKYTVAVNHSDLLCHLISIAPPSIWLSFPTSQIGTCSPSRTCLASTPPLLRAVFLVPALQEPSASFFVPQCGLYKPLTWPLCLLSFTQKPLSLTIVSGFCPYRPCLVLCLAHRADQKLQVNQWMKWMTGMKTFSGDDLDFKNQEICFMKLRS